MGYISTYDEHLEEFKEMIDSVYDKAILLVGGTLEGYNDMAQSHKDHMLNVLSKVAKLKSKIS